ncbi:CD44 antigen isoform X2 [Hyperolius riggenbachi]|uniref:CD44 antigen isoform X2 n=1 Tax=Hyperolius riggenbachi TaxID=752182 RepID=UPI0035A2C090
MSKMLGLFCFGLLCCWISSSQANYVVSCRFLGVFHVEKGNRYNLTSEEAEKTCAELDTAIATKDQVEEARQVGFEICRYGWVANNMVIIPRIKENPICAANFVGIYVLQSNLTSAFDVFCYNASDASEKNCEAYNFKNELYVPHDPTLEEQWTPSEDVTTDSEMSTEHSGDHTTPPEDGDNTYPYITSEDKELILSQTDADDLTSVDQAIERDVNQEEGQAPATDPSSSWSTGSKHEGDHVHDGHPRDNPIGHGSDHVIHPAVEASGSPPIKHKRKSAVPEWLIVCVSLVCLGLIFAVCIALNARRVCGQKKKLVINGNKGSPEDGVIMEQNGDTVKSQEMVQLVSKDQTSEHGELADYPSQEDVRNARNVDMKIGV